MCTAQLAVIQISNDQLSFFNQILCTWQKFYAHKLPFHDWGRISYDRAIKRRISTFISSLFIRRQHHLWGRYRLSRPSRWSRHSFWPRLSFVSLFSFRSCGTRHSCFSGFSRRSYGTLRTFFSFWSPPATWSPRSNGTRIPGGTCRTYLLTWPTVLGGHKLFKLFADFFFHFLYGDASWSVVQAVSSLSYPDGCWCLYWQRADCSKVELDNTC